MRALEQIAFVSLLACALQACSTRSDPIPAASQTPSPTLTTTISHPSGCRTVNPAQPWVCVYDPFTPTPRPSDTPTPRVTPTPSSTPTSTLTPPPEEEPLLIYGIFGGDGGSASDFYFGRGAPKLVLYASGDLVRKECPESRGCQFVHSTLTAEAICQLRSRLISTGLFQLPDPGYNMDTSPWYQFDDTTEYSDGASGIIIQVNGEPSAQVDIYGPYLRYAIRPIRDAVDLLEEYHPPAASPYSPETLLLWIEEGRGLSEEDASPNQWPSALPPLHELWNERVQDRGFFGGSDVVLTSEEARTVYDLFNKRMSGMLFTQEGIIYYLIARPLLPHETPERFSPFPSRPQSFPYPFPCQQ